MDSDSDDDDLLLAAPTFNTRKSKAEDKCRKNQISMLTSMLKDSDKEHASFTRMTQFKREIEVSSNSNQTGDNSNNNNNNDRPIMDMDDEQLRAQVLQVSQKNVSRQETYDTMEGIKADDDGDGVLDRGRRRELMQAFDTDQSSCLGVRNTVSFHLDSNTNTHIVEFYHTHAKAMQDLEYILETMEHGMDIDTDINAATDTDTATTHKSLAVLVQSVRAAVHNKVLTQFLEQKRLLRLLEKNNLSQLPLELTNWLYRLVQSADLESRSLGTLAAAALETLVSLGEKGKLPETFFASAASLEGFCASLECWVVLDSDSAKPKPSASTNTTPKKSHTNVAGLDHLLRFWEQVGISLSLTSRCTLVSQDVAVTTTRCIVALSRLGLDPVATSSKHCMSLRQALQRIISNLLEMVAKQEACGTAEDHVQWMKATAEAVLQGLSDLGPGAPGTEDKDDDKAWLCHSLIVRLFPMVDSNYEPSKPSSQFKAILSIHALEICLRVQDMPEKVRSILDETGNLAILDQAESSLGWLSVSSTYAALVEVEMADDDIAMDGPRCLATVECSFAALEAGMLLLSGSKWGSADEYGDEEQADSIAHMVGLLELQCQQLCKRVAPMANHPHFRRVDYNLICCRQQYRFMKDRASRLSGGGEKTSVQRGMNQFVSRSSTTTASPVGG